jgi:hypothetical protein
MIKALKKLRIECMLLNIINAIYNKPIANIMINGEKLKSFLLMSRMKQGYSLFLLIFNRVLEFLARVIRQKQEINRIQIEKEVVKLPLFADDVILHLKNPKNSTKTF